MRPTFRAGTFDPDPKRDIREEIEAHIAMEAEALISQGMAEEDAWAEARRLFGNRRRYEGEANRQAAARERKVRWFDRFDSLAQDIRYALRRMARNPGFTAIAVLSLALGIGANTAIFSIVNTILLGGVPMRAPEELVEIYTSEREHGYPYSVSSVPDLLDLRERGDLFAGVVGYEAFISRYETEDATHPVMGELVTHDIFSVLGIQPALGRFFAPEEGQTPGTHPVVVLGQPFWEKHFGGDPGILGQTLRVGGHPFTIIGVAPKAVQSFTSPGIAMDMWAPYQMADALTIDGESYNLDDRGNKTVFMRARLRPGVTVDEVRAALATLSTRNQEAYPVAWKGMEYNVIPTGEVAIHPIVDGPLKAVSALLLSVVGLVLLLACVNLAGFLLARASDRKKEIALRLALGARRSALVRQLLVETLVLGLAGGGAVVERHASLRTTFGTKKGEPFRRVHASLRPEYRIVDASDTSENELRELVTSESVRPFDLETGPPLRLTLFRRAFSDWVVIATAHHIVVDFWSMVLLLGEVGRLYESLVKGCAANLPPAHDNYGSFVEHQRELLHSPSGDRLRRYWRKQLRNASFFTEFPTDFVRPPQFTGRGAVVPIELPRHVVENMIGLATELRVTFPALLSAIIQTLVHRYTGQNSFLIGTPFSGRLHRDYEETVGFFVNMLPLRADIAPDMTFTDIVKQAARSFADALQHEALPLAEIVRDSDCPRDASRSPLFQVGCTF